MNVQSITESGLSKLRDTGTLWADAAFRVTFDGAGEYAYVFSPDGEGCLWYDTEYELMQEHF